ncbi:Fe-S cluster assembly protein HesB [Methanomicrobiaceae archaeon CYW5]|uniref:endonuclease III domain-containing protein n=1 Tax=Methanovulcanius yangii TaxID=1789227 RepID=UPI0029CA5D27|nr:Fe-S cluster assembly protein HesB [Methanovulcanius yangii]MBT8507805.1 Fe-S cluster assembly protein HesB [Methanovulcanius yangii]
MASSSIQRARNVILDLEKRYGDIAWWPGTPEEVMIGAVLTQQTRWENVENALVNLKERNICSLEGIAASADEDIEAAIRCTGFFRIKTRRLKALASRVQEGGGLSVLGEMKTGRLRSFLLDINGVGPETADSILCYCFLRASFVIDAYTHRICACAGIRERGNELKSLFESALPPDNDAHRLCHAWFVEYAKEMCARRRCEECRIRNLNE